MCGFVAVKGALKPRSCGAQEMHALEIESKADQVPLAIGFGLTAQGELTEAQDLFDDADDGFDGALASAIDELAQNWLVRLPMGRPRGRLAAKRSSPGK
jgi:hypothetical protein